MSSSNTAANTPPPSPFTAVLGNDRQEVYKALAAQGPIVECAMPTGGTGWLVLGLAESRALLTDPR
ncbi:hypothetical protein ACWCP5_44375, partial [Streptomyces sp. NPDC002159]